MVPSIRDYGAALVATALALGARSLLDPFLGHQLPFVTLFGATAGVAWLGGLWPAVLTTILGFAGAQLLFIVPRLHFAAGGAAAIVGAVAYFATSAVIIGFAEGLRRSSGRAARRAEREGAARERADRARERAIFLTHANAVISGSLDYDETLERIAGIVVPRLADWCSIDLLEEDGSVRRVAVANADPAKDDLAREAAVYPPDPEGRHPRTRVLQTGRAVLFDSIDPEVLPSVAGDAHHLRVMRAMDYASAMIVPLAARGRVIGALTCATTSKSGRHYAEEDVSFAEELAARAALAVDNAFLFRAAQLARADAERAARAKDDLLSLVSHELRTPLASMLGWVGVLRQGRLPVERVSRALEILEDSGRRQSRLIDDLLDLSRISTGRLHLDRRPLDLAAVVRAAVDAARPAAREAGIHVETEIEDDLLVSGDPARLDQVVANLVGNAIKFTPGGGRVTARLRRDGRDARLVVADSGRGIAADLLQRIFEPFHQADPVQQRGSGGGLGLGLAIVRHLVEQHGGTIVAESPGRDAGTSFTLCLPLVATGTAAGRDEASAFAVAAAGKA